MQHTQVIPTKTPSWPHDFRRYFTDWQGRSATVPDFKFPRLRKRTSSPDAQHIKYSATDASPEAHNHNLDLEVDLSSKSAALQSMWHSLGAVVPLPSPTYTADAAADLPESSLSYDVAAAALRQKDFFYQVSLPHYSLSFVRERAVERYATQGGCSLPLQGLPTRHSADCSYHRSIIIRSVIKQGVMQIIVDLRRGSEFSIGSVLPGISDTMLACWCHPFALTALKARDIMPMLHGSGSAG